MRARGADWRGSVVCDAACGADVVDAIRQRGDGIRTGDIYVVTGPESPQLDPRLPSALVKMGIVTTIPDADVEIEEPTSGLFENPHEINSFDSAGPILIGVQATGSGQSLPQFKSRFQSPTGTPGDGGFGGDGLLAGGTPSPSAHNKPPRYPSEARRKGIEGTVVLDVEIAETGKVSGLNITDSSGSALLDNAAIEAVKSWTFEPSVAGARLQASTVRLPIRFVLRS